MESEHNAESVVIEQQRQIMEDVLTILLWPTSVAIEKAKELLREGLLIDGDE